MLIQVRGARRAQHSPMQPTQFAQIRAAGAQKAVPAAGVPAVVPVVPAAEAPAAALVGKRRFGRRVGLTDRRKLLSPADRSRSEIATGAERVMRGASFSAAESTAQTPSTSGVTDSKQEEVIPLAEEELQVGKRTVDRGTAKIRRYVVGKPVEESVTLRDETVSVERRRPVTQGEAGVPSGALRNGPLKCIRRQKSPS